LTKPKNLSAKSRRGSRPRHRTLAIEEPKVEAHHRFEVLSERASDTILSRRNLRRLNPAINLFGLIGHRLFVGIYGLRSFG
jgi:hypothetical protein